MATWITARPSFRRKRRFVPATNAATPSVLTFPTAGWVWNHQAPTLAFLNAQTAKSWVWNHQVPTLGFASAATQKAWVWGKQTFSLAAVSVATAKSWVWAKGSPVTSYAIAVAQKAWRWNPGAPSISGGNFSLLATVLRYLGPVWKRRRSRPPL